MGQKGNMKVPFIILQLLSKFKIKSQFGKYMLVTQCSLSSALLCALSGLKVAIFLGS